MATSFSGTSSNIIWRTWVEDTWTSTTATTTACGTTDTIWNSWVNDTTTNTSSSITINPDTVWVRWVTDGTNSSGIYVQPEPVQEPARIITPEENRRLNELERQRQERVEQERREREERIRVQREAKEKAEVKAQELLLELIGKQQLEVYKKTGHLFVKGDKFNYIIRKHGRIIKFNEREMSELCFHLSNRYAFPDTDNVVAVKMALEGMEDWVLKEANESCLRQLAPGEVMPEAACTPPLN